MGRAKKKRRRKKRGLGYSKLTNGKDQVVYEGFSYSHANRMWAAMLRPSWEKWRKKRFASLKKPGKKAAK